MSPVWVTISGKIASGKDTIADLLVLPGGKEHVSFGGIVREKMQLAMPALAAQNIDEVSSLLQVDEVSARCWVDALSDDFAADPGLTPWSRTPAMRFVLQSFGGMISPSLPLEMVAAAFRGLDRGVSVVSTGTRFTHEADLLRAAGSFIVRVDVDPEVQVRRLIGRDGPQPEGALKALLHQGEVELDSYPFDFRVSNDVDGGAAWVARAIERRVL